jgi:zinc protease
MTTFHIATNFDVAGPVFRLGGPLGGSVTRWTILSALALLSCAPRVPTQPAADVPVEEMPIDPGVRAGVLPNGMRYFIEENHQPENRAVFRLVVEAGSVLEDEDQLGLAHFLEHMAFNGTENFAGNDLIAYLESVGTRFGAHLNAHTSFDETVYKLQVPTDDPEVFAKAFVIMEDWAHGMRLDPEEIEKERGVVLEEWRRGLGAGRRSWDVMLPAQYPDSPYADRLPIGTEESLKSFTHEAVRRFYEDWYRPDLMSLIVVGAVDVDAVEQEIVERFSALAMPESPRERVFPEVADSPEPTTIVFTDPEFTGTSIQVSSAHDWVLENSRTAYRDSMVQSVALSALNERLQELARKPDTPFRGAGVGRSRLSPTEGSWSFSVRPYEGQTLDAFRLASVELRRFQQHGIVKAELDRSIARQMRSMKTYFEERDTTRSRLHAEEIIRHVTTGESMPGIEAEWSMAQEFLPTITIEEVNAFAGQLMMEPDHAVMLTMPEKDGLSVPTVEELDEVRAAVAAMDTEPYTEESNDAPLVSEVPEPGSIVDKRTEEVLGFTVWSLSNGAEVWFKATDFEAEEVLFAGRSEGGSNRVPTDRYVPSASAVGLTTSSGLGAFDAMSLSKRLAGKAASVRPWISGAEEGVRGSAHPDDLELMFQLNWLTFTSARWDDAILQRTVRQTLEQIANRDQNPNTAFSDAWTRLVWQDFERFRPWTNAHVEQMDLAASKAFYEDRFADASDFRFVLVGNTDEATLEPLLEKWIASLPTIERPTADARVDLGSRMVKGQHREIVRSGTEPKARVRMMLHSPSSSTYTHRNQIAALGQVLSVRLREVLREDKGGVYGVSASASINTWPEQDAVVSIDFVCDPERVDELEEATLGVLEELRSAPVDAQYLNDHIAKSRRSREEALRTNSFWLGLADSTASILRLTDEPLDAVLDYDERLASLSPEVLHEMAQMVLSEDNRVVMVHLPESEEE